MPAWAASDLAAIGDAEEIQVLTQRVDQTYARPITIWVVRLDNDLFIRSGYGVDGAWFRRATARPTGRVRAGGMERDVTFEPAPTSVSSRVDEAYSTKYHRYPPNILGPMVSQRAAMTTLRLVPRDAPGQPVAQSSP